MEDIKTTQTTEEEQKQTDATEQKEDKEQNETKEVQTFDYEKLASIVSGKQSATEDSVLKGYFKQQGLSAEEMEQAIASFKEQKAQNTPNIDVLQNNINEATARALKAEMQNSAMLMASELGIDIKAMPFLVRMADVSEVVQNGQVDETILKKKLESIVDAIPSLKQTAQKGGFQTVGVETNQRVENDDEELKKIFGVKRK